MRQHATLTGRGRRGRTQDPEWAARRRLLLGYERHTSESFARMWNAPVDAGEPGMQVLHAYVVKERLRTLLALPTSAGRELISHRLYQFYAQAADSDLPEAHRLTETIAAWWPAVHAAITTGHSNARSEGYNRLAKHVGRDAFGFRNPPTTDAGYAGPAPANTGGRQPRRPCSPVNFEAPLPDASSKLAASDPDYTPDCEEPVSVRAHATTLYYSMCLFDDDLLANHHLLEAPANHSPVLHVRHLIGGRLFDHYLKSFNRVWEVASLTRH